MLNKKYKTINIKRIVYKNLLFKNIKKFNKFLNNEK